MPEEANTTNNTAAPAANGGAPPAAPAAADQADNNNDGVLGRLRDARGAPLSPRARRAKAVPVLRSLRWRYAQAAAPLLRTLRDTARALVALKADSHAAAGRYVGQAYLDRRFLFALDFGPIGARTEQRRADEDPPAFEELAADAQALLDTTIEVADAPAPPQLPLENDAALWATVDAIETSEHLTAAGGAGAAAPAAHPSR